MSVSRGIYRARMYWTAEQEQWLKDNYTKYNTVEKLKDAYNKVFPERTYTSIKGCVKKLKLPLRKYTEEEIKWLKAEYANFNSYDDMTKAFNERFGRAKKTNTLQAECQSLGIWVGIRELPVGSIIKAGRKTYIKLKLTNGNAHQISFSYPFYENYALYMYRQYYGEPPKGYKILHLNMNRDDFSRENLYAISPYVQAGLTREKWYNKNKDLTLAAIRKLELDERIKELE